MPTIPALGKLRQKDHEFTASLGYAMTPCIKKRQARGWGLGGRNDPNNVCTYEYMSKEKKKNH
jgi:hypothetical protein